TLTELLQQALDRMAGKVPLTQLVEKLTSLPSSFPPSPPPSSLSARLMVAGRGGGGEGGGEGGSWEDVCELVTGMFQAHKYEKRMHALSVRLMRESLHALVREVKRKKGEGLRVGRVGGRSWHGREGGG
ncbi:hypothetical protein NSK_005296, partial [Nannochloropsis salina CCMP1776]